MCSDPGTLDGSRLVHVSKRSGTHIAGFERIAPDRNRREQRWLAAVAVQSPRALVLRVGAATKMPVFEDDSRRLFQVRRLEGERFDPWIDSDSILAGELIDSQVKSAIDESDAIVILLSKDALLINRYAAPDGDSARAALAAAARILRTGRNDVG